jgi:hypothetical protein
MAKSKRRGNMFKAADSLDENEMVEEKGGSVGLEEEMEFLFGPEYREVISLGPDMNVSRVSVPQFQEPSPCGPTCLVSQAISNGTISCLGLGLCPTYQKWYREGVGQ